MPDLPQEPVEINVLEHADAAGGAIVVLDKGTPFLAEFESREFWELVSTLEATERQRGDVTKDGLKFICPHEPGR